MTTHDLKILAIDDNQDNLISLQAVLSDRLPEATVLVAPDGPQGLDLAFAYNPDVILLDIVMPGMDGYVVCRKLKKNELLKAIPVIFLTAIRANKESRIKALEVGGEGFLSKPFDEFELVAQIQAMAKIKAANIREGLEKQQLAALVAERTRELEKELAERKRAEEALQESNVRFVSLADNIPGHVAYVNANTLRYEFVNKAFEKSFGIQRDKIIGRQMPDIIGEENYQFALPFIEAVKKGQSISYEYNCSLASGLRWIEVNNTPVFDTNGDVVSLVVLSFDITNRKLAERELLESEARYRRITEGLADYQYTVCVENGQVLETTHNPACLMVTGYSAEEFAADPYLWINMVVPDDRQIVLTRVEQVLAGGDIDRLEHRIIRKDGEVRWVSDNIICYRGASGDLLTYDGVVKDITERKQADAAREKLQEQLIQAQKMEAIGVLAGGIAHDFNNILGAIIGYTEMAKDDVAKGSLIDEDLRRVLTSAHRAKELVKQILSFSRQSVGERMPIKIQSLVDEALKMLRASIPSTIAIKADIDPQCRAILANPTHITQITMNLCSNAFHAMEMTGGVLSVAVAPIRIDHESLSGTGNLNPGEYVELTVRDTGSGIGPDILGKIFDPYFTTKEVGRGTGMGLSIIHGILESYGGSISVESSVGKGTTFHVYFPIVGEEIMEIKEIEEVPKGKERILFLDDEEILAAMGKTMLERLGYTVADYTRSTEALSAFIGDPDQFDLVITDQTMPDMTGMELARRMMQIRPGMPIILCTGFSNLVDEETAKGSGIRAFALKPLSKSTIGQLIKKVLHSDI